MSYDISDGLKIRVDFDAPIISNPIGTEAEYEVRTEEFNWVPGGTLQTVTRKAKTVENYVPAAERLILSSGNLIGVQTVGGVLSLEVVNDG